MSLKTRWTQFTGGAPCLGLLDSATVMLALTGLPNIISAGDGSLLSMGVALICSTVTCRLPFFLGGGMNFIERLLDEPAASCVRGVDMSF